MASWLRNTRRSTSSTTLTACTRPARYACSTFELSGPDEIAPGVVCEAAGGHTEGSMNVIVDTALGKACICGDVVYDIQNQIVDPIYQVLENEPQSTGNQGTSKRQERAAIKKALNAGDILMPIHDQPARVRNGTVVGRFLGDSLEAGETPIEHRMISELVLAPGSFVRVGVVAGRSGRVAASPRMRGCMGKTPRHAQGVQTPRKHHETSRRGHWATWARAASTSGSDQRRRSAGSTSRIRNDGRTRGSFCPSENIEVRCPPRASAW